MCLAAALTAGIASSQEKPSGTRLIRVPERVRVVPRAKAGPRPLPTTPQPAASKETAPAGPPGPLNLTVAAPSGERSENQLDVRWDPVPGALGYEVLIKRNGRWHLNEEDPNYVPITNSTSLSGLPSGSSFEIAVRAVLPQGLSALSSSVLAQTSAGANPVATATPPPSRPLPVLDQQPPTPPPAPPQAQTAEDDDPLVMDIPNNAPITDLVPPPPKPVKPPASAQEAPKGPPPPAPEGVLGVFAGEDRIRLSWRPVREATGYVVEELKENVWTVPTEGVIGENRPSVLISPYPAPGPYVFRIMAVRGGARSGPSLPVKVER